MTQRRAVPRVKRITKEFVKEKTEQVFKMAQIGCTDKEISHILSVGEDGLRNNFRTPLSEARSELRRSLRRAQLECAIKEKNTTMLIWLGKNYLGQKEPKNQHEHSGGVTVEKVVFSSSDKKA